MTLGSILSDRKTELISRIKEEYGTSVFHTRGFVNRVLGYEEVKQFINADCFDLSGVSEAVKYEGFPYLAYLGFAIGMGLRSSQEQTVIDAFVLGLNRLQERSRSSLDEFLEDDVALLGVADGIATLFNMQVPSAPSLRDWLIGLSDDAVPRSLWSSRMRDLSVDLLDERGRLREKIDESDTVKLALELSLCNTWPYAFRYSSSPDQQARNSLLKNILYSSLPDWGGIEQTTVWLKALDVLVDESVEALTPDTSDVVRLLTRTQHSFKRWVWDINSRRTQAGPAHWLIDTEAHVQSFLWSVLYPVFGPDLVDEKYLPDFGQVQPRFDLGITKLKLIIEVKVLRTRSDFAAIEEQVAGDLGLYFKELERFDRMVVYVYDDCDNPSPENYEALRNALMSRERIEEVVIVRRPSMIPNRNQRKS